MGPDAGGDEGMEKLAAMMVVQDETKQNENGKGKRKQKRGAELSAAVIAKRYESYGVATLLSILGVAKAKTRMMRKYLNYVSVDNAAYTSRRNIGAVTAYGFGALVHGFKSATVWKHSHLKVPLQNVLTSAEGYAYGHGEIRFHLQEAKYDVGTRQTLIPKCPEGSSDITSYGACQEALRDMGYESRKAETAQDDDSENAKNCFVAVGDEETSYPDDRVYFMKQPPNANVQRVCSLVGLASVSATSPNREGNA